MVTQTCDQMNLVFPTNPDVTLVFPYVTLVFEPGNQKITKHIVQTYTPLSLSFFPPPPPLFRSLPSLSLVHELRQN